MEHASIGKVEWSVELIDMNLGNATNLHLDHSCKNLLYLIQYLQDFDIIPIALGSE